MSTKQTKLQIFHVHVSSNLSLQLSTALLRMDVGQNCKILLIQLAMVLIFSLRAIVFLIKQLREIPRTLSILFLLAIHSLWWLVLLTKKRLQTIQVSWFVFVQKSNATFGSEIYQNRGLWTIIQRLDTVPTCSSCTIWFQAARKTLIGFTRQCTGTLELTILVPNYVFQWFQNAILNYRFHVRGQKVAFAKLIWRIRFGISWLHKVTYFSPCVITICSNHSHSVGYSEYRFSEKAL